MVSALPSGFGFNSFDIETLPVSPYSLAANEEDSSITLVRGPKCPVEGKQTLEQLDHLAFSCNSDLRATLPGFIFACGDPKDNSIIMCFSHTANLTMEDFQRIVDEDKLPKALDSATVKLVAASGPAHCL